MLLHRDIWALDPYCISLIFTSLSTITPHGSSCDLGLQDPWSSSPQSLLMDYKAWGGLQFIELTHTALALPFHLCFQHDGRPLWCIGPALYNNVFSSSSVLLQGPPSLGDLVAFLVFFEWRKTCFWLCFQVGQPLTGCIFFPSTPLRQLALLHSTLGHLQTFSLPFCCILLLYSPHLLCKAAFFGIFGVLLFELKIPYICIFFL